MIKSRNKNNLNTTVFTLLSLVCLNLPSNTLADHLDIWCIMVNNKTIINSGEKEILFENNPMQISILNLSDFDTLKIVYDTDHGAESWLWCLIFKDVNGILLGNYINEIDSGIKCFPTPCKVFTSRKKYMIFSIKYLKGLLKGNKINKIIVEFEPQYATSNPRYHQKPILIISND